MNMDPNREIEFVKMEGTGNDYVYLDLRALGPDADLDWLTPERVRALSDRRRGVGGDGVIVIAAGTAEDEAGRMRMWNADGSTSAMCGNGLRSLAWFVGRDLPEGDFVVTSDVGRHRARVLATGDREGTVEVEIGAPRFATADIPFAPENVPGYDPGQAGPHLDVPLEAGGARFTGSLVSMGNPHCVIFVDDADRAPVLEAGRFLERHPAFPERTNVEFVSPEAEGFYQRTFERGTGETLSCGSGACAVHVSSVLLGKAPRRNRIRLRGGTLELEWNGNPGDDQPVILRGPVREVFRGRYVW